MAIHTLPAPMFGASLLLLQGGGGGILGIILGFVVGILAGAVMFAIYSTFKPRLELPVPVDPETDEEWPLQPLFYEPEEQPEAKRPYFRRLVFFVPFMLLMGASGAVLAKVIGDSGEGRPIASPRASVPPIAEAPAVTAPAPTSTGVADRVDSVPDPDTDNPTAADSLAAQDRVPALLVTVSGADQVGRPGVLAPEPLSVQVLDQAGQPVGGATVEFEVTSGGGRVSPRSVTTGTDGIASARWTLGASGSDQRVVARTAGVEGPPVTFAASTPASRASRVVVVGGGDQEGVAGAALPEPVEVEAQDEAGDAVPDVPMVVRVVAGGGEALASAPATDEQGRLRVAWTLGAGPGANRLEISSPLLDEVTVIEARGTSTGLSTQRAVIAGGTHSCSVAPDGVTRCWGGNESGQLGDGSGSRRTSAASVAGELRFARLSAGISHTCGITGSGDAYCWGANDAGQVGDGTRVGRATPVRVGRDLRFRLLDAAISHTCGVTREGAAYCWGANVHGQLGDGTTTDRPIPTAVTGAVAFQSIAAGWSHTCALGTNNVAYCWGRNAFGQLGDGSTTDRAEPAPVPGIGGLGGITAGSAHSCAIIPGRDVYCWGQNTYGQLGDGTNENRPTPARILGSARFVSAVAGGVHTCGLTARGEAYCWGRNTYGQLGDGTNVDRAQPVPVEGGLLFSSLFASGAHTCGVTIGGNGYCWGYNVEGQLGDGTRVNRSRPARVAGS